MYLENKSHPASFFMLWMIPYLSFILSLYLMSMYTGGDQIAYNYFYEHINIYDFVSGFDFYRNTLSSSEPVYYVISWLCAPFLDKEVMISLFNGVLAFVLIRILTFYKISVLISLLLIFLNFYTLVLFGSAERLKFAVLFFLLAVLYKDKERTALLFIALSVLSHIQILILYSSLGLVYVLQKITLREIRKDIWPLAGVLILFLLLVYLGKDHLLFKLKIYLKDFDILNMFKVSIFFIITFFYRKKLYVVIAFLPLVVAALIVGDARINIFAFIVFLFFVLPINKGINWGIIIISIYYAYKGVDFLLYIYFFGNGFH